MSSPLLTRSWMVPATHPRAPLTVQSPEAQLFIAVNEYRPRRATSGATLLLTHGTSFCKELWEPLIEYWLRGDSPLKIQAVFAMDAVNHGDSAVFNQNRLGSSRHSFGGGTLAHASILSPKRFDATILVEPIIFQMKEQTTAIAKLVLNRRDTWKNRYGTRTGYLVPTDAHCREEACALISNSKGFADWTLDQRKRYAATYLAGPHPEIIHLLSKSREPRYYVMGGKSLVLNNECRAIIQDLTRVHGDMVVIEDGGHLGLSLNSF
ncbi:hypothetical protein BDV12DRAFT_208205 [Aspergillus spectabilis]